MSINKSPVFYLARLILNPFLNFRIKKNTGLKTSFTSINTFKDNSKGENTGNGTKTQGHLRKMLSKWTLRSCKKVLVLLAVDLGVATCLKQNVF